MLRILIVFYSIIHFHVGPLLTALTISPAQCSWGYGQGVRKYTHVEVKNIEK